MNKRETPRQGLDEVPTNNLTIHLVNRGATLQTFWCFLVPPPGLDGDGVFANSSTSLAVRPNDPGTNEFVIPIAYFVGAGASFTEVKASATILSSVTQGASAGERTSAYATYAGYPPPETPALDVKKRNQSPRTKIEAWINRFDKVQNERLGWFSSMSFGMKTNHGVTGLTWSPDPKDKKTIFPVEDFYVAVGAFQDNTLVRWTDVMDAGVLVPESSFSRDAVTVTVTSTGQWIVTPGYNP